ncbi:MAG: glycyl-radical enzyme activating protein [Pseudomonadota bacterium]
MIGKCSESAINDTGETCRIFDIKRYAIHDGPGIRTTVFFKGCPLKCRWCHNPESLRPERHILYNKDRCIGCLACVGTCPAQALTATGQGIVRSASLCTGCGSCADICPSGAMETVGRSVNVRNLLAELEKDLLFFDGSGGGVTVSGGEPLLQHRALIKLLKGCRDLGIHTAVDTSGFAPWDALEEAAALADLFLFDLKLMDEQAHRLGTGVSNSIILANLRKLSRKGADIILRIPLVHTMNDSMENLEATGLFINSLHTRHRVEILPFHDIHSTKYKKFSMINTAEGLDPTTPEQTNRAMDILASFGLDVSVNG